jgi:hypothetical protein
MARFAAPTELVRHGSGTAMLSVRVDYLVMKGHEDGGKCSLEWRKLFSKGEPDKRFPPISLERR